MGWSRWLVCVLEFPLVRCIRLRWHILRYSCYIFLLRYRWLLRILLILFWVFQFRCFVSPRPFRRNLDFVEISTPSFPRRSDRWCKLLCPSLYWNLLTYCTRPRWTGDSLGWYRSLLADCHRCQTQGKTDPIWDPQSHSLLLRGKDFVPLLTQVLLILRFFRQFSAGRDQRRPERVCLFRFRIAIAHIQSYL